MIRATPRPLSGPASTPTALIHITVLSGATSNPSCPSDSTGWNLVQVFPNNNDQRIDPPCVYAGLDKPIAWLLAAQGAGYTNPEAFQKLGFAGDLPYDNSQAKIDVLPSQGRSPVAVTTSWSPLRADYRDWYVVNNAVLSDTFTLGGCYRTYDMIANQAVYWSPQWKGSGATMICEVAQDRLVGWDVSGIRTLVYSKQNSSPTRAIAYFIYDNRPEYRAWYFAGYGESINMTGPVLLQAQSDLQKLFASPLWNLAWLEQTYGMVPVPLPQNWQQHSSLDDFNRILAVLNQ